MGSDDDSGFTLIEVLVALVILVVGLSTFYQAMSTGLITGDAANRERETSAMVANFFEELGQSGPLQEGTTEGIFSNGQEWTLRLKLIQSAVPNDTPPPVTSFVATLDVSSPSNLAAASRFQTILVGAP